MWWSRVVLTSLNAWPVFAEIDRGWPEHLLAFVRRLLRRLCVYVVVKVGHFVPPPSCRFLRKSYHLPLFAETRRSERGQGEWSPATAVHHLPPPSYCTRGSLGTETSVTRCNRYSACNYVLVLTADRDYWQLLTSFSLNTNVIIIIRILKGSVSTDPSC